MVRACASPTRKAMAVAISVAVLPERTASAASITVLAPRRITTASTTSSARTMTKPPRMRLRMVRRPGAAITLRVGIAVGFLQAATTRKRSIRSRPKRFSNSGVAGAIAAAKRARSISAITCMPAFRIVSTPVFVRVAASPA